MAKGAVGLVAGYWPEDIFRYLAVPGLSLDECLVVRPARRRAEHVALAAGDQRLEYRQLAAEVEHYAALLAGTIGDGARRLAIVSRDPLELAVLFLAGLKARCTVLLADAALPENALLQQLEAFEPELIIDGTDDGSELPWSRFPNWRVMPKHELARGPAGRPGNMPRIDLKGPAVALAGPDQRLVYHSHASLVAWAVSWSAFVPLTEQHTFCSLEPLTRWSGLLPMLATLFRGGTCSFLRPGPAEDLLAHVSELSPDYLIMPFARAAMLALSGGRSLKQTLYQHVQAAFVTVEAPFTVRERRRIESAFGVPVLTLLGNAACGPALAAHPSWYLDESVGIPVTNVDCWPLNPADGQPLAVPWEAIDYGELGVRSPMLAAGHETVELHASRVRDGWLRMAVIALMDPSGLFYLRPWR